MNISINLTKSPDGSICPSFTVTPGEDAAKPFTLTPDGAQQTKPSVTSVDATLPLRSTVTGKPGHSENIQTLSPSSGVGLPGSTDKQQESPKPTVDDLTRFPGLGVYKTADGKEARITHKDGDEWVGTVQFPQRMIVGEDISVRAHWAPGGKFKRFWHDHPDKKSCDKRFDLVKYISDLEEPTSTPWRRTSLPVSGPGKYKTAEGTTVTFAPLKPGRTSPIRWGDIEYPQDSTAPRRGCWEAKTGEFIRFAGKSISDANARRHRLQIVQCINNGLKVRLDEEPPAPTAPECMVSKTGFYDLQGSSELVLISPFSPDSEVCEGSFFRRTSLGAERCPTSVKAVWERASGRFVRWDYEKDTVRRPWLDLKCLHKPMTAALESRPLPGIRIDRHGRYLTADGGTVTFEAPMPAGSFYRGTLTYEGSDPRPPRKGSWLKNSGELMNLYDYDGTLMTINESNRSKFRIVAFIGNGKPLAQSFGGTAVEELERQRVPKQETVPLHEADVPREEGATLVGCAKEDLTGNRSVEVWKVKGKDGYCIRIFRPTNDGKTSKLIFGLTTDATEALLRALSRHHSASLEQRFREVTKKATEAINKGLAEKGLTKDPLLVPGFFKTRSGHSVCIPEDFLRTLKDGMVHGFLERRDRVSGDPRSSNTWVVRRWNVTNGRYMNNLTETSLDIIGLAAIPRFIEL